MSFKNGLSANLSGLISIGSQINEAMNQVKFAIENLINDTRWATKNDITLTRSDIERVDDKAFAIQQQASEILIKLNALISNYDIDIPTLKNKDIDPSGVLDILEPQHRQIISLVGKVLNIAQKIYNENCCIRPANKFGVLLEYKFSVRRNGQITARNLLMQGWSLTGYPYRDFYIKNVEILESLGGGVNRISFDIYSGDYLFNASDEIIPLQRALESHYLSIGNNSDPRWPVGDPLIQSVRVVKTVSDADQDCDLATLIKELFEDLNFKLDAEQELNFNAPLTVPNYIDGAWTDTQKQINLKSKNDALIKTYTELVKVSQDLFNFKNILSFDDYPIPIDENHQHNTLTDLILNSGGGDLSKIEKILGIELDEENKVKILGKVPKSLYSMESERSLIEVKNYPELFVWFIRQFDMLIGEFPIKFNIQDADLLEEGDQTKSVKIGNIAEGLSEIFGFVFQQSTMNDASLQILLRLIPEITRIRQLGLTNQDILIANREFLGYREKEVKKEIDSNFTLMKDSQNLAKMLEPEKQKYKSIELDPKSESLFDYLTRFQYIASLMQKVLIKKPKEFDEFINKQAQQEDVNLDDWNTFLQTINDPTSFFNLEEKASRVRDVEED